MKASRSRHALDVLLGPDPATQARARRTNVALRADHPTGFAFDVQIKRPGGNWQNWKMGQKDASGTFVPDQGTGTYQFRARYKDTVNSKGTAWSGAVSIQVS